MQNKKNSVLNLGVGTIIYILLSALVTPILTRLVSPDAYGRWSMFVMYGTLVSNFILLGMDQAFIRFFYVDEAMEYRRSLLKNCIKVPLAISAVLVVVGLLVLVLLEKKIYIAVLFGVYLLATEIGRFGISILRLEYKTKLYSLMQCADKMLLLLFTVVIVRFLGFSDSLIVATTFTSMVMFVVYLLVEKKYWLKKSQNTFSNKNEVFKYAIPSAIALLITSLFQAVDRTVINFFCGDIEVGIYAGAMSIVNVFAIVQTVFSVLWMPMAIEHYEKKGNDYLYIQANKIITFIMVFMGLGIILCKDILIYFLGVEYRDASAAIPFLIFMPIMYTVSETTVLGIVFKKKTIYQIWVGIGSLVVNLLLALVLVPKYGVVGASVSSACAYLVFFCLRTYLGNKVYPIKYDFKFSAIAFSCLISFAIFDSMNMNITVKFIVFLIFSMILIYFNRQILIEILLHLRRQKR